MSSQQRPSSCRCAAAAACHQGARALLHTMVRVSSLLARRYTTGRNPVSSRKGRCRKCGDPDRAMPEPRTPQQHLTPLLEPLKTSLSCASSCHSRDAPTHMPSHCPAFLVPPPPKPRRRYYTAWWARESQKPPACKAAPFAKSHWLSSSPPSSLLPNSSPTKHFDLLISLLISPPLLLARCMSSQSSAL